MDRIADIRGQRVLHVLDTARRGDADPEVDVRADRADVGARAGCVLRAAGRAAIAA